MNPCLAFTFALTLSFSWASLGYAQDEAGVAAQDEIQATEAENNAEAGSNEGQQVGVDKLSAAENYSNYINERSGLRPIKVLRVSWCSTLRV